MVINVVVVEDEQDIRTLMRIVIEGSSADITICGEAAGAREAFDVVDRCRPDVVVLDERLPGMTGCEVAEELVRRQPSLAIILCSAHVDTDLRRRAEAAGVRMCLAKGDIRRIPDEVIRLGRTPPTGT